MKMDVFHHASVRLESDVVIYVDPYNLSLESHDADYIFITHDHYDHYDENSISKIRKDTTKVIVPSCLKDKGYDLVVKPGNSYKIDSLEFEAVAAYNTKASYHPKEAGYVGYNILVDGLYYYIMGDTNRTPEADKVKTDVCFVPIGGTYTMDVNEAIQYINNIKPKMAVPIHYGSIVGDVSLGEEFKSKIESNIKVEVFI